MGFYQSHAHKRLKYDSAIKIYEPMFYEYIYLTVLFIIHDVLFTHLIIYISRVPCTKVPSQSTSSFRVFTPSDRSRRGQQAGDASFTNFATQEKL